MNAAFIIFFACFGACMATDARAQFLDTIVVQGQQMVQTVLNMFSQQVMALAQQVSQQLQQLTSSLGGKGSFDNVIASLQQMIKPLLSQLLTSVVGQFNLSSIFGGRGIFDTIKEQFQQFLAQVSGPILGIGQHFVNQGLSAVLGAVSGGRIFGELLSGLTSQLSALVSGAQTAVTGIMGNLQGIVGNVIDASKPHLAQLQEQLIGHGLNVLNSIGNTVTDLHGSLTGGR